MLLPLAGLSCLPKLLSILFTNASGLKLNGDALILFMQHRMKSNNLTPIFSKLIAREKKEHLLQQKSKSIWFIGLSGSGKTTLALELERYLFDQGFATALLDGDNVRTGINSDLGFSTVDRHENIRRVAEINKLFVENGIIVINSFVCPTESMRQLITSIIGKENVVIIYVQASLKTCMQRDVKGLYKKAIQGEISQFTGISDDFEEPQHYDLLINTENKSKEQNVEQIISFVVPKLRL
jgi:adenylylsulfate kinase